MKDILDTIVSNSVIFAGVIIVLCAVLVTLIILIIRSLRGDKKINIYEEELEDEDIKKVKNVKKEDIIESPSNVKEEKKHETKKQEKFKTEEELEARSLKEIEKRYDSENEKEIEEILEETQGTEIEKLIKEMEESTNVKPEEVVANFEEEQEAQSIISYRDLVDAVRNRQDEYYEDELESRPLTTVSNYKQQQEVEKKIPKENNNKFKKTEVISPIFGRVSESKIDNTNRDNKKEVNDIYNHMAKDLKKNNEATALDELTKNEEFLKSLKDFRKKL